MLRSIRIDVLAPFLADREVGILTRGSGLAAVAAARRWSLSGDAGGSIEVDSVWVHLGPDAVPARIGAGFEMYAEAAEGRHASTRLTLPDPPEDAGRVPWPLRATDIDVMGHVNNAAYWSAVEQVLVGCEPDLRRKPVRARLDYRQPLDLADSVELVEAATGGRVDVGFAVGNTVRAVARVESITA